jgi:hypothetical protein
MGLESMSKTATLFLGITMGLTLADLLVEARTRRGEPMGLHLRGMAAAAALAAIGAYIFTS